MVGVSAALHVIQADRLGVNGSEKEVELSKYRRRYSPAAVTSILSQYLMLHAFFV